MNHIPFIMGERKREYTKAKNHEYQKTKLLHVRHVGRVAG